MASISPSSRSQRISESITLAISARAASMRAEGLDVISLGAGEPDFGTAEDIAQAGIDAIRNGRTRYTAAPGLPEVRDAAATWFEREFDLRYERDQIIVTAGAKPALMMALQALVDPGDRVLIPAPYWPSYPHMVRLADGEPIDVAAMPDNGFVHDRESIATAAREHGAKGILINYPNNPSGAVPSRDQIGELVAAAVDADLWIISDEIYARLIYDGLSHVSPANFDSAYGRTIVINGGTKSHSMTGWRTGFLAGPPEITKAIARIQSQAIGNTCTISQLAAKAMCEQTDSTELNRRLAAFDERRHFLHETINAIAGLALDLPRGAFYALVDARLACKARGIDDVELCEQLLTEALVATVPGSPFACPGFLRLSYAASMDDLQRSVERIKAHLEK